MPGRASKRTKQEADAREGARRALAEMPECQVRYFAEEYLVFLQLFLGRETAFTKAVTNEDIAAAREHAEKAILLVQDLIDNAFNDNLRRDWYGNQEGIRILHALEDAVRSARLGDRHWLTRLEFDYPPATTQKRDPVREIVTAKAAALLHVFGQVHGTEIVGARIARALNESNFKLKTDTAPSSTTVREWLANLRARAPGQRPSKRNGWGKGGFEQQYKAYCRAQRDMKQMNYEKAIKEFTLDSKRLVPRMLRSEPRR